MDARCKFDLLTAKRNPLHKIILITEEILAEIREATVVHVRLYLYFFILAATFGMFCTNRNQIFGWLLLSLAIFITAEIVCFV